jgi:hypothetical protein
MNSISHHTEFCRDTFADALPGELRDQMISRMTQARRRKRRADLAAVISIAVLFAFLAVTLRHPHVQPIQNVAITHAPIPVSNLKFHTVPFEGIVHSVPIADRLLVRSSQTTVAIVRTDSSSYEPLSDEQFFQALKGWSVALVKVNGVSQIELYPK